MDFKAMAQYPYGISENSNKIKLNKCWQIIDSEIKFNLTKTDNYISNANKSSIFIKKTNSIAL